MNRTAVAFPQDCRVPEGWIVCNIKICENCGLSFVRDSQVKFCAPCRQRLLMPPEEDAYRDALPEVPHHPNHELVNYDDSLKPRKVVARVVLPFPRDRRPAGKLGKWFERLESALKKRIMTRAEMIKITGHCDERSLNSAITQRGLKLKRVASVWPRRGRGTSTGYYKIVDCE